jgi:periplasmic protein TonB
LKFISAYLADHRTEVVRWSVSFAAVVGMYALAALAIVMRPSAASDFDAGAPVVMLDLPEAPAIPPTPPNDVTPGPPEEQSDPTPLEEETKPPMPEAEVALPEPPKPEPPREERVATATPSVAIPPSQPAPPTAGAEVQPLPRNVVRWESTLAAHLERFKRYPAEAMRRDQQGIVKLAFTIDREGHVLSSQIVQSSGSPMLDEETLAMLQRAQPLPAPPANIPAQQLTFVVPVRFNIR